MLANTPNDVRSGGLDPDVHLPSTAKMELVAFIAQELPRWRDHKDRPNAQAETVLTEHLCDHLNSATYHSADWSHVQFRTETRDETNAGRKIDLTVKPRGVALVIEGRRHSQFEALFPIECKRLPTPEEKDRDEREYVITATGTTGGIQRFKFGHHGAAHQFAAMIAYVQERTHSHWLNQVNDWIRGLSGQRDSVWRPSEILELASTDSIAHVYVLKSRHRREGNISDCELRHLWIEMN